MAAPPRERLKRRHNVERIGLTVEMGLGYHPRQFVTNANEVTKMSMQDKSAQTKSARGASVSDGVAQAKSAPATRGKSATRKDVQPPEWEDDEFDRAIAKAAKAGLLDDMIADALQAQRDGKTTPL